MPMTSPALAAMQQLRRVGFGDEPILAEDGSVEAVYFRRQDAGWRDVVLVYSERRARGYRVRAITPPGNPLRIDPSEVDQLIPTDDVVTVVHVMLSRPPMADHQRPGNEATS